MLWPGRSEASCRQAVGHARTDGTPEGSRWQSRRPAAAPSFPPDASIDDVTRAWLCARGPPGTVPGLLLGWREGSAMSKLKESLLSVLARITRSR